MLTLNRNPDAVKPLTAQERKELRRLNRKWALRTATKAEMVRCRELESRDRAYKREVRRLADTMAPKYPGW